MRATFVTLALVLAASARPSPFSRRQDFNLKNGQDAIALNDKFKTLTANSACQAGDQACINGGFAQCVNGKFVVQGCAGGTTCAALPLTNAPGTTIACTTQADIDQRIAATGATDAGAGNAGAGNAGANNGTAADQGAGAGGQGANNAGQGGAAGNAGADADPQTSLTLDPKAIADFSNDGQDVPAEGQVASLTSTNNFINFCLTRPDLPLTNGKQITDGSCNPAPIGLIPSTANMPSSKFVNPVNQQQIPENTAFTISMAIRNMETGFFVNAQENYFSAPQQLNAQGQIQGHSHVVVEKVDSFTSTTPNDPNTFEFFKGLNGKAQNGILTADVDKGLPAGFYKLSSINAAANHQPVIVPIAQHASLDDAVYFEVVAAGAAGAAGAANATAAA